MSRTGACCIVRFDLLLDTPSTCRPIELEVTRKTNNFIQITRDETPKIDGFK